MSEEPTTEEVPSEEPTAEEVPAVVPTIRIDNVILGVRTNAAAYDDCILKAGAQARESVERGIIGHDGQGNPTPPDVSLLRGTNAEITPLQFLLSGLAAQFMIRI